MLNGQLQIPKTWGYSQALIQNKIGRQRVRSRESGCPFFLYLHRFACSFVLLCTIGDQLDSHLARCNVFC